MNMENDQPVFEVVQPGYCIECQHYHYRSVDCPERGRPCGSYLCCRDNGNTES